MRGGISGTLRQPHRLVHVSQRFVRRGRENPRESGLGLRVIGLQRECPTKMLGRFRPLSEPG